MSGLIYKILYCFYKKANKTSYFLKEVMGVFQLYDIMLSVLFQHDVSRMITHAKSKDKGIKVGLKNTTSEMHSQFL